MLIKQKSSFVPAPEGTHNAVCVDAVDMYQQETRFGTKDVIRLFFEIDQDMPAKDDFPKRPYTVMAQFTASINEKANFYKFLKSWFGRGPKTAFDTEDLVGKRATLVVQHNDVDGTTYANIVAILKPAKSNVLEPSEHYIRVKDRPAKDSGQRHSEDSHDPDDTFDSAEDDSSIPF